MLRVYIAESLAEGQLVVNLLEGSGVPSELFHQNSTGGLGELPVVNPEVWIKRDLDHEKARRLVKSFCGRPSTANTIACPFCGEHSPDSFELCWQCHGDLPTTDS